MALTIVMSTEDSVEICWNVLNMFVFVDSVVFILFLSLSRLESCFQ